MKNKDNKTKKVNFKETVKNFKMLWKYAKNQKINLLIYFISSLFLCLVGAVVPFLSARMLLNLTGNLFEQLLGVACIIFSLELFRNVLNYISSRCGQSFFLNSSLEIRKNLVVAILDLETSEVDKTSSGVFVERVGHDVSQMSVLFPNLSSDFIYIITNIGVLLSIFVINKYMFFYLVISMLILYKFEDIRMKKYWEINKKYRKLNEKNTGFVTEVIRGIRDIKVLNVGDLFLDKSINVLEKSNDEQFNMQDINRKYRLITGSIKDLFDVLFIILGIYLCQNKLLTIASFVVIYTYRDKIRFLLNQIISVLEKLNEFNLSSTRVFELFEDEKFKKEKFGNKKVKKIKGDIEFRDVEFSYTSENPILKKMSFKINSNVTVSFVGKSGAGKSTIFSLIARLYDIDSGSITLDGIPIKELDKNSLRNNITIITQNPYIFNFSIRENLALVKKNLTEKEMVEVCKMACLHDFIMSLPEGYDTVIGEGGVNLSGGERQRLAIARALLQKTEIILFDEATSALDNDTQLEIQKAINNMKNEYTILIVAHRLSTVIGSDKIFVIDDGKIAGFGTHEELIKSNKIYKNLYTKELK